MGVFPIVVTLVENATEAFLQSMLTSADSAGRSSQEHWALGRSNVIFYVVYPVLTTCQCLSASQSQHSSLLPVRNSCRHYARNYSQNSNPDDKGSDKCTKTRTVIEECLGFPAEQTCSKAMP